MRPVPSSVQRLYHALVPPAIRFPIGRCRRSLLDLGLRLVTRGPLPPRRLLLRVQMTPYLREYLDVGRRAAATLESALADSGCGPGTTARVLDFGCGLGRTLRFLPPGRRQLHGCDVDAASLEWTRHALPAVRCELTSEAPPLPYPSATFEALYAVSVFTHFEAAEQTAWAAELGRILEPGGSALITTMGPWALASFPSLATAANRRCLEQEGFFFHRQAEAFNSRGAFHTRAGLERIFAPTFELRWWTEGGLDGFQDLTLLRKRQPAEAG